MSFIGSHGKELALKIDEEWAIITNDAANNLKNQNYLIDELN